ncbi:MAG: c-type cytochrome [Anaerolineales bacterium]
MKYYILVGMGALAGAVVLFALMGIGEQPRMESFTRSYNSRRIEEGAAIFDNNCRTCHGPQGEGGPLGPTLNNAAMFTGERLQAFGWGGTLDDFLRGTISAGRPVPSEGTNYPERMPTWSEAYGGPLRIDQIESVVGFILNWEERALAGAEPTPVTGEMMGSNIQAVLPRGDPEAGHLLAAGTLACAACHILSANGPAWAATEEQPGVGERAALRVGQDDYQGEATSAEEYLIESVIRTNAYVVPGYADNLMPSNFGERITLQNMADLLAYMLTFR